MHDVADTAMSEKEFEKLDAKIEHVADACGIAIGRSERKNFRHEGLSE